LPVALQKIWMMKNKLWWYIGFFGVLLAGYMIVVFSQTDISQSNLPVINNNVDTFAFTDQNGKMITEKDVDGKVYVAEYFFTTCRGICPKMNTNMRRVYDDFKNEKDFMIISHTCMPEVDSVPLLKDY
jgi:protein SCO1/2